jgi:hypothetical protein
VPKQVATSANAGARRPRWGYNHPWYSWEMGYGDSSSVQSGLTAESYPYDYGMYSGHVHPYYGYPPQSSEVSHNSLEQSVSSEHASNNEAYHQHPHPHRHQQQSHHLHAHLHSQHWMNGGVAHPHMYAMHPHMMGPHFYPPAPVQMGPPPGLQPSVQENVELSDVPAVETSFETYETPYKYDLNTSLPMSPFWSHLDRATIAMGLATPAKTTPGTPRREGEVEVAAVQDNKSGFAVNAQPLLLRPNHYYGYGTYGVEQGYGPPSPATQFMMSPQASFAYNYGYGFSPRRRATPRTHRTTSATPSTKITPPPTVLKSTIDPAAVLTDRQSPVTVDTTQSGGLS